METSLTSLTARLKRFRSLVVLNDWLEPQKPFGFLWSVVFFAGGIGCYFALPFEPALWGVALLLPFAVLLFFAGYHARSTPFALLVVLGAFLVGIGAACVRTASLETTLLSVRYYGAVEGKIVQIDRSSTGRMRLTLNAVQLEDFPSWRTPGIVRLSLPEPDARLTPGMRIAVTALLSPPNGPTEPGAFDFRRYAYFKGIGAMGYSRLPVEIKSISKEQPIARLRHALGQGIKARMNADVAGVAIALSTGDKSHIAQDDLEALRTTNLAHLLAISGLHMGLLTGVVFAACMMLLALSPRINDYYNTKPIAALAAITVASGYLLISGAGIATQRAYVMVLIFLLAIVFKRQVLSLRNVAFAALLLLLMRPEALVSVGFQMSFAATTALIVTFSWLRERPFYQWLTKRRRLKAGTDVFVASLVAGLSTAPVAAASFHYFSSYGLLANLACVPLMGALIMPLGLLSVVLAPFDLEALPLQGVSWALSWILGVAHEISSWETARRGVVAPEPLVLPCLAAGGLWALLWQGRSAAFGALPIVCACFAWASAERPSVIISERGDLIGVMQEGYRALNKASGSAFVAQAWLRKDGDLREQDQAYTQEIDWSMLDVLGWRLSTTQGRGREQLIQQICQKAAQDTTWIVITHGKEELTHCMGLTPKILRKTGALALMPDGTWKASHPLEQAQRRPWSPWGLTEKEARSKALLNMFPELRAP